MSFEDFMNDANHNSNDDTHGNNNNNNNNNSNSSGCGISNQSIAKSESGVDGSAGWFGKAAEGLVGTIGKLLQVDKATEYGDDNSKSGTGTGTGTLRVRLLV